MATVADTAAAPAVLDDEPRELAPGAERGRTRIADKVVDRVAVAATAEVDQVLDATGGWTSRLTGRGLPSADAVVAGRTCKISVDVAVPWTASLPAVAAQVRDHVGTRVADLTGFTVTRVDVTVADVVHAAPATRRVR